MLIDAAELFLQRIFLNAVVIIQTRLRAPANVEGGIDVVLRPFHDLAQLLPVVDLLKGNLLHGSARDDQTVKGLVPDLVKGLVEGGEVVRRCIFGGVRRHLQQLDIHLQRTVAKQAQELGFGGDFGGHEVEDEDFQRTDVLSERDLIGHDKDVLTLQYLDRGQIALNLNRHILTPFAS